MHVKSRKTVCFYFIVFNLIFLQPFVSTDIKQFSSPLPVNRTRRTFTNVAFKLDVIFTWQIEFLFVLVYGKTNQVKFTLQKSENFILENKFPH